jgi:hypothetical protein
MEKELYDVLFVLTTNMLSLTKSHIENLYVEIVRLSKIPGVTLLLFLFMFCSL